jgi:hypothetical protein
VGLRNGLDAVKKRKITGPSGNRSPAVQPVAIPTKLSRLLRLSRTSVTTACSVGTSISNLQVMWTEWTICYNTESRDSAVGIATGYGLDERGV